MSRPIAVLRPEPGNRVTAAAIEARGRRAIRLPLFAVRALDWRAPDPSDHDALLLTSANAPRHAGPQLARLAALPTYAVGEVTAEAARRAGLEVALTGDAGAEALLARAEAAGVRRALHLAGRERMVEAGGIVRRVIAVYASEPLDIAPEALAELAGCVALVQSARAGARLRALVDAQGIDPAAIALAAISARAAEAAGSGWGRIAIAQGDALIDGAIALAD